MKIFIILENSDNIGENFTNFENVGKIEWGFLYIEKLRESEQRNLEKIGWNFI